MKSIKWGILGTGNMARNFARDFSRVHDGELVAVASRDSKKANMFADEFTIPQRYSCYEDLAKDSNIDIVYIATPHNLHAQNSILCLEAGRAVLCEKPFTINSTEAEKVFNTAYNAKKFLMEAMWTRCLPVMQTLQSILEKGTIGQISMLQAGGGFMPAYDPDFYLFDAQKGGGVLLDAGVYLVHFAVMILGDPDRVRAVGHISDHKVDDQIGVMLGYDGGAMANLYVSLRMQSKPEAVIYGEQGKIQVHGPIFNPSALTISLYDGDTQHIPFDMIGGYAFQAMEAMRCLREGVLESPLVPWSATRSVMSIMDEARRQIGLRYPIE